MKLTNQQVFETALSYESCFKDFNQYIPVKANFFLQKNINTIIEIAQKIEEDRLKILKHYGEETDKGFKIAQDKLQEFNKEMTDLFFIEQELNITIISLDAFGDTQFTQEQLKTIMFMIGE